MRQYLNALKENTAQVMQQMVDRLVAAGFDEDKAQELVRSSLTMDPSEREAYFVRMGLLPDRETRMSRPRYGKFSSDPELDALFQSKDNNNMNKTNLNEEITISGSADELIRIMKLAGASDAAMVTPDTISQGSQLKPCSICGKMHDPETGGCSGSSSQSDMADYIRMVSKEEEDIDDGDFGDASTAPDENYMNNVSASIPNGNDLNRKKAAYRATQDGDNPMALEDEIRSRLQASLAEKMKSKDEKVSEDDDPCWKGYEMIGMKKKNGKDVPNCVPKK